MYKRTFTDLTTLDKNVVLEWLDTFDTVLTDCDGVLWLVGDVIENSQNVVNKLQEIGKKVFFITNNSTQSRADFLEKAHGMNYNITVDGIISSAYVAAKYLANRKFDKTVYVIGTDGITKELDAVGIKHIGLGPDVLNGTIKTFLSQDYQKDPDVGAVIVGFDHHFSFPKMIRAASYLDNPDCIFIGTNTDERFPTPDFIIPGTGAFVTAIETCSLRKSLIMGKPNPLICETIMVDHNIDPKRTLMIGDRCNTDILLGTNCGFQTMLVGTGIHNLDDVRNWHTNGDEEEKKLIPDVYLPKLGDLLQFIENL